MSAIILISGRTTVQPSYWSTQTQRETDKELLAVSEEPPGSSQEFTSLTEHTLKSGILHYWLTFIDIWLFKGKSCKSLDSNVTAALWLYSSISAMVLFNAGVLPWRSVSTYILCNNNERWHINNLDRLIFRCSFKTQNTLYTILEINTEFEINTK